MDDYAGTSTPTQNFITIRLSLSQPPYMRKCALSDSGGSWGGLFLRPTAKTIAPIFTINASMTSFRAMICVLGQNFTFWPNFPQNENFGSLFDGQKNSRH